jgi:hypothetical protein
LATDLPTSALQYFRLELESHVAAMTVLARWRDGVAAYRARAAVEAGTSYRRDLRTGGYDTEARARVVIFQQKLHQLGWTDGRNVRVDIHWAHAYPVSSDAGRKNRL